MTTMDYISIMNSTVNESLIKRCKRALTKMGYSANWDSYVNKWVLC